MDKISSHDETQRRVGINMEDLVENVPLLKYELVVAWYEFILNREKLSLHLKRLCDVNGKFVNITA